MSTACWLPEMCTDEYTFLAGRCHSYGLYKLTGQNASLTSSIKPTEIRTGYNLLCGYAREELFVHHWQSNLPS